MSNLEEESQAATEAASLIDPESGMGVEVVAPLDLPGGYYFECNLRGDKIAVTVVSEKSYLADGAHSLPVLFGPIFISSHANFFGLCFVACRWCQKGPKVPTYSSYKILG